MCARCLTASTRCRFWHTCFGDASDEDQRAGGGTSRSGAAGLACGSDSVLGVGVITLFGSLFAEKVRKATPRAALLSTLSGIALGFISLGFLFRTFAHPIVGLATLSIVLLTYFGRVKFKGGLPGGLVAVGIGTALAWATKLAPVAQPVMKMGLHLPIPVVGDLFPALGQGLCGGFAGDRADCAV